jgi:hypothetical protein
MAATIKAINARIRSNKVLDYFCSTRMSLQIGYTLLHRKNDINGVIQTRMGKRRSNGND